MIWRWLGLKMLSLFSMPDKNIVLDLNQPVIGKTYSLFGSDGSTNLFYETVASVINRIMEEERLHLAQLLDYLQHVNRSRRELLRNVSKSRQAGRLSRILELLHDALHDFTPGVEAHLKSTPSYKIFTDKELFATREQYYLYMIEFELVNRIHQAEFMRADYRIALLPYCLRETQVSCKAEPDQLDFQCKGCLKGCYINHVSSLLKAHGVEPYIWRRAKLKPMLKRLVQEHGKIGVAGIACIVELVMGMRRCMKAQLPVVGIPLNANRCPRWMGDFHATSVDLNALERLLAPDQDLS